MNEFIPIIAGDYILKLAKTKEELEKVYKLRYEELLLSYNKANVNEEGIFIDKYDPLCDHLICYDRVNDEVAGTYRLVLQKHIESIGSFVTEEEYDITKLKQENLLELGRAVVKEEYRNGAVIMLLWKGLIRYAMLHDVKYMFGTGSFHGLNPYDYDHALTYIYYNHLSPEEIRVSAKTDAKSSLNLVPMEELDAKKAKQQLPALIKGYIKIGATFGDEAFLDYSFNSLDVFVLFDVEKVNPKILQRFLSE